MRGKEKLIDKVIDFTVRLALTEDVGPGDITSRTLIPPKLKATARILAKEKGIICGLALAREVFRQVDKKIRFAPKVKDGARVKKGRVLAIVSGPARGILAGERVALNFLQHLSGIATLTGEFVSRARRTKHRTQILDTRKTIPGLRVLEKYAVKMGGGVNHRMGLYDAILIKDNHIKLAGGMERALKALMGKRALRAVEIEAGTIKEVRKAVKARVGRILLDNMNVKTLRQAVKLCKKARIKTEASGRVNLMSVRAIAKTGVDYISIGALTHSARALDISLKMI